METNNPIILGIYDIIWEQSRKQSKDLPKEIKLQWIKNDLNQSEVSDWLSEYFKAKVSSLKIKKLNEQPGSGWGGCC